MASDAAASGSSSLDDVADVEIDESGRFKYVLIRVHQSLADGTEKSKFVVRGFAWGNYHSDIYEHADAKLHALGLDGECVGGGRIEHQPRDLSIKVFGYSQGYGKADHSITTALLKKHFPHYTSITCSDEGY